MAEMKEVWVDYVPKGYEDKIPGHKTYVQIYGECAPGKKPLLVLHGGPGDTHNYLLDLAKIADKYDRQVIFYDQIGCGKSMTDRLLHINFHGISFALNWMFIF